MVKKTVIEQVSVKLMAPKIDEKAISKETDPMRAKIRALAVVDQESKVVAGDQLLLVKAYIKKWESVFKPMKDALNQAKQAILDQEHRFIDPAKEMEKDLKDKISTFLIAEDERIAEETAAANALLEKQAAKDRAKLDKAAARAEARGDTDKAEELRNAAAVTTAVTVVGGLASEAQAGLALKDDIEVTVTDLRAFCLFVVQSTDSSLEPMLTVKVGGIKTFLKFHNFDTTPPGLSIKKVKQISASAGGM